MIPQRLHQKFLKTESECIILGWILISPFLLVHTLLGSAWASVEMQTMQSAAFPKKSGKLFNP